MGFFKDERFDSLENELVVVKGGVSVLEGKNEVLVAENGKLKEYYSALEQKNSSNCVEIDTLKGKQADMEKENDELKHRLKLIEDMLQVRKEENEKHERDIAKEIIMDAKFNNDWLTIQNMCKLLKISNQTKLKYYLYECGIYDININIDRNTFSINTEKLLLNTPAFIDGMYKIEDGKLLLHINLAEYFKIHSKDIDGSYAKVLRKNAKYKESKKELESKVVEDYQAKINEICGTDANGGYNKKRWGNVYDVFRKTFSMLEKNYKSYTDEFGYISKVKYVVTEMGQGNYLLKIACELYA